jgi:hypothetical protein
MENLQRAYSILENLLSSDNAGVTSDTGADIEEAQVFINKARADILELADALAWCEAVYGQDWPEKASIRELVRKHGGKLKR